jgi:phosphatidylserine decarboxylase
MNFARYAKKEVLLFKAALACDILAMIIITAVLYHKASPTIATIFGIAYAVLAIPVPAFLLSFFRDPTRKADREKFPGHVMIAPADGKITEITQIEDPRVGGPAIKVGIFLSVFNVHINRVPCRSKVVQVEVKPGEYLDARNLESSKRNRCVDMTLEVVPETSAAMPEKIVVRQIAGLIAKQIVCDVTPGQSLEAGSQYGMIKFGSRTELIVPAKPEPKILVQIGQAVRAGEDMLISYQ